MRWLVVVAVFLPGLLPLITGPGPWLKHAYPVLARFWQAVPVPLTGPLLAAAVLLPLLPLLRGRPSGAAFMLALVLAVAFTWFSLGWGVNYLRPPLYPPAEPVTAAEAAGFRAWLLEVMHETAGGRVDPDVDLASGRESLNRILEGHTGVTVTTRVRHAPAGLLAAFGVSGFIDPFTLTPHVEPQLTDFELAVTALHELAHVGGVASEAEATLLAAIAGLTAQSAGMRHATALHSFWALGPEPEELAALPPASLAMLQQASDRVTQNADSVLPRLQRAVYGTWLRTAGQGGSITDYARGHAGLVQAWRAGVLD